MPLDPPWSRSSSSHPLLFGGGKIQVKMPCRGGDVRICDLKHHNTSATKVFLF